MKMPEEAHNTGEVLYTHYKYDLVGNRTAQIDRFGNETHYYYYQQLKMG